MNKLVIYTDPKTVTANLRHDNGVLVPGQPATQDGREGIGFTIAEGTANFHGCAIELSGAGLVPLKQRGILVLRKPDTENGFPWHVGQTAALIADDFYLATEKVCPEVPKPEPPKPPTNPEKDPLDIIEDVYDKGDFDLSTKEGCGKFTEACCVALHEQHSSAWGHLQKFPPQNHWPTNPAPGQKVHGVDVVQLLTRTENTTAGVYDIIFATESDEARPAFTYKGTPEPTLWYYPE